MTDTELPPCPLGDCNHGGDQARARADRDPRPRRGGAGMKGINILLTKQAVNYGDHAQDVTRAVLVDPLETVENLVDRALTYHDWGGETKYLGDAYLTIRIADDESNCSHRF